MKKSETTKRVYMKPVSEVLCIATESILQASGNAGTVGPGNGGGDAKQGWFEEEEEDENESSSAETNLGSLWED